MTSTPTRIASRISDGLKRFQSIVEDAKKRDINESDTVALLSNIIAEVLGYDRYTEITREVAIRGTFCDMGLKIDGKIKLLLEAKAIGIELKDQHMKQAVDYAANQGLEWVVLSNAVKWRIYKIVFSKPVNHKLFCEFDFLNLNYKNEEDIERLFILTKEAVSKSLLSEYYTQKQATSRFMIGNLICSDSVVQVIRRELHQIYPDIKVQNDEIKKVLLEDVVKRELLEGEESEDARKKIAKAYRKKEKVQNTKDDVMEPNASSPMIAVKTADNPA